MCDRQRQCCICLDEYTHPVSIPCGHSFCLACIGEYWRCVEPCLCPLCLTVFPAELELRPQSVPEQLGSDCVTSVKNPTREQGSPVGPGEVPCDVCSEGRTYKAVFSCLECLTSYCPGHLEPHYQTAELRKHQLVAIWKNLQDSVCNQHGQPLDHFCRTDRTCICTTCSRTEHWGHRVVPVVTEWRKKKIQLRKIMMKTQRTIQDKVKMVEEVSLSAALSRQRNKEDGVHSSPGELGICAERNQADLVEVIKEKQRSAAKRTEEHIAELEKDITELKRRNTELEQLSNTEDHIQFLQMFSFLCGPPNTKCCSELTKAEKRHRDITHTVSI